MEGKRDAIRTVLQSRFNSVPASVETRIAHANADELNALVAHAGTVANLDEL